MTDIVERTTTWLRERPGRLFDLWTVITVALVIAIFLFCALMWNSPWLRPALATGGAGLAALLGPIPGMLSPNASRKWLSTALVAALIAAGTWFATRDLDDRLRAAESEHTLLEERLTTEWSSFEGVLSGLAPGELDAFILQSARQYKSLYKKKQFQALRDFTLAMLEVRPTNGHALYYAGEAARFLGDTQAMFNQFQNYIAASDQEAMARDGDAAACYARPNGYRAERLGWIAHLMANAYLDRADAADDGARLKLLGDALNYEQQNLNLVKWKRPSVDQGFHADPNTRSSCEVLGAIAQGLVTLGKSDKAIVALRRKTLWASCPDG